MSLAESRGLRRALDILASQGEALERIGAPVQAFCELAAIYAPRGGGVPVAPPTRSGPAFLFERVQPSDGRVLVGLFGSRRRCAALLGVAPEGMAERLLQAVDAPIAPVLRSDPVCQEVVRRTFDLRNLPVPTLTSSDAGPYLTLGVVVARDPDSGRANVSIHRMCVKGSDELTIWMVPGRHLETLHRRALEAGRSLPVAIHVGLDPAIAFASCCTDPLVPIGFDELGIAGGLRGEPVALSPCVSVDAQCISDAEYVLEGVIGRETAPEGEGGGSMPEFLGYAGAAHPCLPVVKVRAVTHRHDPIFQAVIGPGYEQSNLLAIPMEAATLRFARQRSASRFSNAYCSSAGGGQLLLFLQVDKQGAADDAEVRLVSEEILRHFRMVKHVVLVDRDVDVFSEEDVWWAMTTRFQADCDLLPLPDVTGFPLDPSQSPEYSPRIRQRGRTCKAVFDCTVPWELRPRFARSRFVT